MLNFIKKHISRRMINYKYNRKFKKQRTNDKKYVQARKAHKLFVILPYYSKISVNFILISRSF